MIKNYFELELTIGKKIDDFQKEDWDKISKELRLDETLMKDYMGNLNMDLVSAYQSFSYEFAVSYLDKVNLDKVLKNKKVKLNDNERLKLEELKKIIEMF